MAKRVNKTSALKQKIKRQIRTLEKRGFQVSPELKQKINDANYSRLKSYQKEGYKRLYSEIDYVDYSTGTKMSGTKGRLYRRAGGAKKQQEYINKWYKDKGYKHGDILPDKADQIISNVIDDLVNKLQQEIPEYYYDTFGKKRWLTPEKRDRIEQKRRSLIDLIQGLVADDKSKELANRLEENAASIAEYTDRLISYFDDEVSAAYSELYKIINDGNMSLEQMIDNEAYSDFIAGYDEPD